MDLMLLFKTVLMGIVEGATEFIPVSSTGHLILAGEVLGFKGPEADSFAVFIQLGAILAIVWLYRQKVIGVFANAHRDPVARQMLINLAIACVPAAIMGFLIYDWLKDKFFNPVTVAWALLIGGVVILLIEKWNPAVEVEDVDYIPPGKALGVGLAQILSLFPGVSRSG